MRLSVGYRRVASTGLYCLAVFEGLGDIFYEPFYTMMMKRKKQKKTTKNKENLEIHG